MVPCRQLDIRIITSTAADLLTRVYKRPVKLARIELIRGRGRHLVLRAFAVLPSGETNTFVIKVTRSATYDAAARDIFYGPGIVGEWAATALLTQSALCGAQVPRFVAGDASMGMIVLQDLGAGLPTLMDLLLASSPTQAEKAILEYAAVLGEMHKQTVGCRQAFEQIAQTVFPNADLRTKDYDFLLARWARSIQFVLGGVIDQAELAAVAHRLNDPGPWLALVHGDPCPDNVLFKDDRPHLIDFEFARPRHVLFDVVYWSMGFPTCSCAGRVSEKLAIKAEHAYRAVLSERVKESADEQIYRTEMAHICVARMLMSTTRNLNHAIKNDRRWGNASDRDRILWWLRSSCIAMDEASVLRNTRALVGGWLTDLQARWSTSAFIDYYPAFKSLSDPGLNK